MCIRSKKVGDSLRTAQRGCSKSLKKLFTEAKIPAAARGRIPVIADENGLMAVIGFGAQAGRLAEAGENSIMIEWRKRDNFHEYDAE